MAFSFELKLAIFSELYGAISAGPEQQIDSRHNTDRGGVNLLEGYGADNPASKSQGIKQLVAGGGVALIGMTLVPLLSGLLG